MNFYSQVNPMKNNEIKSNNNYQSNFSENNNISSNNQNNLKNNILSSHFKFSDFDINLPYSETHIPINNYNTKPYSKHGFNGSEQNKYVSNSIQSAPRYFEKEENKYVHMHDNNYDIITQRYNQIENEKKKEEANRMVDKIAKAKDFQLKFESLNNVLNLKYKLKPMEDEPQNIISDNTKRNQLENYIKNQTKVNYNLLSCKSFQDHLNVNPDIRPFIEEKVDRHKGKQQFKRIKNTDFNILSGEYVENHDLKADIDKKAGLLEASLLMHKKDTITQKYNIQEDERKMQEFEENQKTLKAKRSFENMPKTYQK